MYPLLIRLTIENTKDEVLQLFKTKSDRYLKTVVCEEEESRHHLHILTLTNDENTKNARQNVKNFLKKAFPLLKDNAKWQISKVYTDTIDRMGSYVVKEGNYAYYGFSEDEIEEFKKGSFSKAKKKEQRKEKYGAEYKDLVARYQKDEIEFEGFIREFYNLRIKYDNPISTNQAHTMFEHQLIKKSENYRERRIKWHLTTIFGYY